MALKSQKRYTVVPVTGQLADATGDFACLVFLLLAASARPRVVQLPVPGGVCCCFSSLYAKRKLIEWWELKNPVEVTPTTLAIYFSSPVTLNFDYDLDIRIWPRYKVNHRAKYGGQRSSNSCFCPDTWTHAHTRPITLPRPLKWSVKGAKMNGNNISSVIHEHIHVLIASQIRAA